MVESFEFITELWPSLSGCLIMPATAWLKKKIAIDSPILTWLISIFLSFVAILAIVWLCDLSMEPKAILRWIIATNLIAQGLHVSGKTIKKNLLTTFKGEWPA